MKNHKRIVSALVAVLLACGAFAGCAPKDNSSKTEGTTVAETTPAAVEKSPVTLSFLFGDPVMMDWFSAQFPDYISGKNDDKITVEPEYQKEANKVLQVKAAAGEIPDMVSLGLPQEMMDQGKFLDLSGEAWWENLAPTAKELSTDVKSGKNYYIPMCMGAVGLFYNKDIFTELGLTEAGTWDALIANLTTIKEKKTDVSPFYICGKEAYTFGHMIDFMVDGVAKQKLGYVGFEKATSGNDLAALGWNNSADGIVAAFADGLLQMQKEGLLNKNVLTASYDNQIDAFVTGKAAMISQGVWALSDMQKKAPDFKAIGFAPYPSILDGTKSIVGNTLDFLYLHSSREQERWRCENRDKCNASSRFHKIALRNPRRYPRRPIR